MFWTILLISFFIFSCLVAGAIYVIILGGNLDKTDEERRDEDIEQIIYLKNYKDQK